LGSLKTHICGFSFVILVLLLSLPKKLKEPFSAEEKIIAIRRCWETFNIETTDNIRVAQIWGVLKDPKCSLYIEYCYDGTCFISLISMCS
jgi:hypothetical protein